MNNQFNWNYETYTAANNIQTSVGEYLIDTICFSPDMSVLDAGCGSGNLTVLLAKKVPDGYVLGIDSSESMIENAKKSIAAKSMPNLEFRVCGINEIEFDEQFDLIFSNSVLHWVVETEDGLRRLFRALNRGGRFVVQFPILNAAHPLIRYARRAIKELGFCEHYEKWIFPWYVPDNREQFAGMLEEVGFTDIEVSMKSNLFTFPSAGAVYQHFNSVGLDLLAAPLDEEEKEAFLSRVLDDLKDDFSKEATLRYERIFAEAGK